jgi:diaminopimelate epimerase
VLHGTVPFTKLHGLGNDYLYVNCFDYQRDMNWGKLAREMADRHFGPGSDGLILVLPSEIADFRMRMFNSDGSEGDMCGNGMRCFAKYVYERGLTEKMSFTVETRAGIVESHLTVDNGIVTRVCVDMGVPLFGRSETPLARLDGPEPVMNLEVTLGDETFLGTPLFLGNPHCVFFTHNLAEIDLERIGPGLERHPLFPRKANIEFVEVKSRWEIDMRVWERGSGITLACGTGACASVVAAVLHGFADRGAVVTVNLPGGALEVIWRQDGHVWQMGPAVEVYRGIYFLNSVPVRKGT